MTIRLPEWIMDYQKDETALRQLSAVYVNVYNYEVAYAGVDECADHIAQRYAEEAARAYERNHLAAYLKHHRTDVSPVKVTNWNPL